MNIILPALTTIVGLLFAAAVFNQYRNRKKSYQLIWTLGLVFWAIGTAAEFVSGAFGISELAFRVWYLFGAVLTAAYLGMGTVYLLVPRKSAHIILGILLAASIYTAIRIGIAPLDLSVLEQGKTLTGTGVLPQAIRLHTPFFNTFGTVALVGGAIYSAWVFWRKGAMPHRVISNILIAVGALLPAMGGSFARFGNPNYLYASEFLGVVVIFIGFLRSKEVFGKREP